MLCRIEGDWWYYCYQVVKSHCRKRRETNPEGQRSCGSERGSEIEKEPWRENEKGKNRKQRGRKYRDFCCIPDRAILPRSLAVYQSIQGKKGFRGLGDSKSARSTAMGGWLITCPTTFSLATGTSNLVFRLTCEWGKDMSAKDRVSLSNVNKTDLVVGYIGRLLAAYMWRPSEITWGRGGRTQAL